MQCNECNETAVLAGCGLARSRFSGRGRPVCSSPDYSFFSLMMAERWVAGVGWRHSLGPVRGRNQSDSTAHALPPIAPTAHRSPGPHGPGSRTMTRFSHGRWAAFLALGLAASLPGLGRSQTWVGPGTDWNTAANWSPAGVPNSATAVANFNGTGPGGVNISSGAVVNGITFSNPTGSYTLTARPPGLSCPSHITLSAEPPFLRQSRWRPRSPGRRRSTWPAIQPATWRCRPTG